MGSEERETSKLGVVKATLRVVLYADDVLVGESEDPRLWIDVLQRVQDEADVDAEFGLEVGVAKAEHNDKAAPRNVPTPPRTLSDPHG